MIMVLIPPTAANGKRICIFDVKTKTKMEIIVGLQMIGTIFRALQLLN